MIYLLAKIFFLLLLSALGGALLMYWWVRRRYQDITLAYTNSQSNLQNLESSYATLNEKNMALQNTIHEKIDNILTTVNPLEKAIINIDADNAQIIMKKFKTTGAWNLPVIKKGKYYGYISKSRLLTAYRRKLIHVTNT